MWVGETVIDWWRKRQSECKLTTPLQSANTFCPDKGSRRRRRFAQCWHTVRPSSGAPPPCGPWSSPAASGRKNKTGEKKLKWTGNMKLRDEWPGTQWSICLILKQMTFKVKGHVTWMQLATRMKERCCPQVECVWKSSSLVTQTLVWHQRHLTITTLMTLPF